MIKVAPVSADLLIKLALGAAVIGVGYWSLRKAWGAAGSVFEGAGEVLDSVAEGFNPTSDQNYAYKGTNAVLDKVVSADGPGRNADGSVTLGGWLFDVFNPSTAAAVRNATAPTTVAPVDRPDLTNYNYF